MQTSYLESKVLTATPPRLHLLLIEGAIRFGRQAEEALQRGDQLAAAAPLLRVLDILGELLAGVRKNKSDLTLKIAELYLFLFKQISKAKINADATPLAEALRLLEFERQTWQLLCEKLGGDLGAAKPAAPHVRSFDSTAPRATNTGVSWQA
jgi:flagellar protein FliS